MRSPKLRRLTRVRLGNFAHQWPRGSCLRRPDPQLRLQIRTQQTTRADLRNEKISFEWHHIPAQGWHVLTQSAQQPNSFLVIVDVHCVYRTILFIAYDCWRYWFYDIICCSLIYKGSRASCIHRGFKKCLIATMGDLYATQFSCSRDDDFQFFHRCSDWRRNWPTETIHRQDRKLWFAVRSKEIATLLSSFIWFHTFRLRNFAKCSFLLQFLQMTFLGGQLCFWLAENLFPQK